MMIAFGPVSSRRLGFSLGINNIQSHKICTYSCVYCQLGKTAATTLRPEPQYDPDVLINTVNQHLAKLTEGDNPDYLTLVARGEPTLDSNLGTEISSLKESGIPVAVITNASLLSHPEVRKQLMPADWVSLKMDAANERTWMKINNPHAHLDFSQIGEGIRLFCLQYTGQLHTETMLLDGINDSTKHLEQLARQIALLGPVTAYISVPIRPPAYTNIRGANEAKLTEAWNIFESLGIKTEVLSGFEDSKTGVTGNAFDDILNITAVHPLREDMINELLNRENAPMTVKESLLKQRLIKKVIYKGNAFYTRYYPGNKEFLK